MKTKKTLLTPLQLLRLINVLRDDKAPMQAYLVEVVDTPIKKLTMVFGDHTEDYYPNEEDLDFILNGLHVERNKEEEK